MNQKDFEEILKIQRMMASKIMEESTTDSKIKMLELIRNLATNKNKKIHVEEIIHESNYEGFSEDETIKLIEELIKDKTLIIPEEGFVKFV